MVIRDRRKEGLPCTCSSLVFKCKHKGRKTMLPAFPNSRLAYSGHPLFTHPGLSHNLAHPKKACKDKKSASPSFFSILLYNFSKSKSGVLGTRSFFFRCDYLSSDHHPYPTSLSQSYHPSPCLFVYQKNPSTIIRLSKHLFVFISVSFHLPLHPWRASPTNTAHSL